MAKIGINLKIDVTKIDKSRLFQGEKGLYLELSTVIDTDGVGNYGDHGIINHRTTKEEREQKVQMPILGNARIYFSTLDDSNKPATPSEPSVSSAAPGATIGGDIDDGVPF